MEKPQALVLIHPFPFSAEAYEADVEALHRDLELDVIGMNMRGFGGAAPFDEKTPPSIDAMADDVAAMLDKRSINGRVIVGGHSMGGYVSLAFARRHPQRLGGLVLCDTRAEPDSDEAKATRDATIKRIHDGDVEGYVEAMLEKVLCEKTHKEHPEIVDHVRSIALKAGPIAIVDAVRALRDRPDARPHLSKISVPTLIIVGKDDVVTPPSAAEVMHRAIAGSELVTIADAGHLSNLEQPTSFRNAVTAWVSKVRKS